MGSFNVTCGLTGCSIHPGDKCFYIPITVKTQGLLRSQLIYIHDLYTPLSFPIQGKYDDYGRLEIDIETSALTRLKEHYNLPDNDAIFDYSEWEREPDSLQKLLPTQLIFHKFDFFILEEALEYLFQNLVSDCGVPCHITGEELWLIPEKEFKDTHGVSLEEYITMEEALLNRNPEAASYVGRMHKLQRTANRIRPYVDRSKLLIDCYGDEDKNYLQYKEEIINALIVATTMDYYSTPFVPRMTGWQSGNSFADIKRAEITKTISTRRIEERGY